MTTKYYCPDCQEEFEEDKLPNMFKTHECGSSARIVSYDEAHGGEVE